MLGKLSSKFPGAKNQRKGGDSAQHVKRKYKWRFLVILPIWVLTSYLIASSIVFVILWALELFNASPERYLEETLYTALVSITAYILSIVVALAAPYYARQNKTTLKTLGLSRLMSWTDIGLSPAIFLAYVLTSSLVFAIVVALIPSFPADQIQDIGFNIFGPRLNVIIAFFALIVVAPVAEEVLFRGYLYGKLKIYVPAFWAAVATSVTFAAVHMQWNVAIDVFVLSMFLCWLRSLTGSLWASILVHMIKNSVAFFILLGSVIGG